MATLLIMALKEESQQLFENHQINPYYCGVGQLRAAFLTQKLIAELQPQHIINLGTAGSHSFKQGSLVECTSFVQRIANNFYPVQGKTIQTTALTHLPKAVCGTADFVEQTLPLIKCDVMDMEAYAMAYVCTQFQVQFTSIKYVTDNSNENTLSDWKNHLKISAPKLLEQYLILQQKIKE